MVINVCYSYDTDMAFKVDTLAVFKYSVNTAVSVTRGGNTLLEVMCNFRW